MRWQNHLAKSRRFSIFNSSEPAASYETSLVSPLLKFAGAGLIDNEPQIRRLLRITLESNGYQVFDAPNGKDEMLQAAQCRPKVILLDLGLPDMDGIEILKRVRELTKVAF